MRRLATLFLALQLGNNIPARAQQPQAPIFYRELSTSQKSLSEKVALGIFSYTQMRTVTKNDLQETLEQFIQSGAHLAWPREYKYHDKSPYNLLVQASSSGDDKTILSGADAIVKFLDILSLIEKEISTTTDISNARRDRVTFVQKLLQNHLLKMECPKPETERSPAVSETWLQNNCTAAPK